MNTAVLTFFLELCGGKLCTCIWLNCFQIPPAKFVYFSKSRLKCIKLIHYFFCSNYFHTIKLWGFWVCITKIKIIRKGGITCQTFWCCCWNNNHKTHLKVAFSINGFLDLAFFFIEHIWHEVQKRVCIYLRVHILLIQHHNRWCSHRKLMVLNLNWSVLK